MEDQMLKKDGGFLGHARRAASAASVLALFSSMTGAAYADGKYTAQMSIPGGQAPTCANTPKTVELTVAGSKVTTAEAKCVGELQADGSFKCSYHGNGVAIIQYAGHIAGSTVEGTYQLSMAPPPPAQGGASLATRRSRAALRSL
jgi:hypothetical protein